MCVFCGQPMFQWIHCVHSCTWHTSWWCHFQLPGNTESKLTLQVVLSRIWHPKKLCLMSTTYTGCAYKTALKISCQLPISFCRFSQCMKVQTINYPAFLLLQWLLCPGTWTRLCNASAFGSAKTKVSSHSHASIGCQLLTGTYYRLLVYQFSTTSKRDGDTTLHMRNCDNYSFFE